MAAGAQRERERHHRVNVTDGAERGEQNPHESNPRAPVFAPRGKLLPERSAKRSLSSSTAFSSDASGRCGRRHEDAAHRAYLAYGSTKTSSIDQAPPLAPAWNTSWMFTFMPTGSSFPRTSAGVAAQDAFVCPLR